MNKIITTVLLVFGTCVSFAQQIPVSNQYMINKYALTPAYAGVSNLFEAYLSYRQNWIGIDGAPQTKSLSVNGPLGKHTGIGGSIAGYEAGIFRNFSASISYAYHIRLGESHSLSFGVGAGYFENYIDVSGKTAGDVFDPMIESAKGSRGTAFEAKFGMLYRIKKVNLVIDLPRLFDTKIKGDGSSGNVIYTLKRQIGASLSYPISILQNWQIEPHLGSHISGSSSFNYEFSSMFKYKNQVWLGASYRKGTNIGIAVGFNLKRFILNYMYEISGGGIKSTGSHEITIGLFLGKMDKEKKSSIFNKSKRPYDQWINN